jgi:hypothetical protein
MIGVYLTEETREFTVRVGRKIVGKVILFSNGRAYPRRVNYDEGGYSPLPGANVCRTMKQATDQILLRGGYGKSEGIVVERKSGGIAQ